MINETKYYNFYWRHSFDEIGDGSGGVTNYSWNRILHQLAQFWQNFLMEVLLEFRLHVIWNLSDAMADSISDFWVFVGAVPQDHKDDWLDLFDVSDIFSHLGQGHDGGVLD